MGSCNSTTRTHSEKDYQQLKTTCSYQEFLGLLRDLRHPRLDYLDISLSDGSVMRLKKNLELRHVILNSPTLLCYTNEYLENSVEALTFIIALKKSLIPATIHGEVNVKDPVSTAMNFERLFEKQSEMVDGLHSRDLKLQKKLRSVRAWRKASSIVFKVASAAASICSLVFVAVGAVPAVPIVLAAATAALKAMEELLDTLLSGREKAFGEEHKVIREMLVLFVTNQHDCFQVIIKQLKNDIRSGRGKMSKNFDGFKKVLDLCIREKISIMGEFRKIIVRNDT